MNVPAKLLKKIEGLFLVVGIVRAARQGCVWLNSQSNNITKDERVGFSHAEKSSNHIIQERSGLKLLKPFREG